MLDLLKTQIEEADAFYKQLVLDSNGEYKESRIDIKAKNFKSSYFMEWQKQLAEVMKSEEVKRDFFLKSVATAHPEHYAMSPYPAGIIETIGEHVARVQVRPDLLVPDFVKAYGDPSYVGITVTGLLDDGTVLFYVLHEFRDAEDGSGCHIILRLLFPAAAPQVLFDEHAQHLAVEFRAFITEAYKRFKWSYRNNLESYQHYRFRPCTMVDITEVGTTLSTTILGYNFSAPFFISPCGRAVFSNDEAELGFVQGAAQGDIMYMASWHTSLSLNEIAAAKAKGQVVFQQVYLDGKNDTAAKEAFARSEKAGAKALVYTADSAADGNRQRAARFDVGSADTDYTYITWEYYEKMKTWTPLPIIIKGIGTAEDVKLAIKHKVPAIVLSNHGARQLDGSPSALETAIEIFEEDPTLFDQIEIYADGGVRYGADALKLLALGFKAVGLGRPFMFANVYGAEGVKRAIDLLKHEIAIDAGNLGLPEEVRHIPCSPPSQLAPHHRGWQPNPVLFIIVADGFLWKRNHVRNDELRS
ncbi:hypothetical protein CEP54_002146 [Fusarium duplospermum]|uniref:FMN hydroxy acid dehydrogenase domain-containing protein n=1 Tax=Fusarium duplospermum TaxID=1325734 RepID=A0A428QX13_9HYPO|nr:hypothetical protein CEP54_002146 [Fusarium duplospermum]